MKPNRNRVRDIGFYVLLLIIIVAVIATMTRDSVSESLVYSDLIDLFKAEKVESFVTEGSNITLKVRTGNAEEPLETKTYSLYSFSVFYEDFHELIREQYEAGIIKEYDYTEGFTLPWWVSFVPYLILIGLMILWFALMNRQGGGAGGIAKFSRARTRLGSEEKNKTEAQRLWKV